MEEQNNNRRKKLYVYKDTQRGYVTGYGLAALAVMIATGFSIFFMLRIADMEQYQNVLPFLVGLNIAILLGLLLMIMALALVASHKVGGPLFHCQRVLGIVTEGDLRVKVRLRDGDRLHGLADVINDMVESLNNRVTEVKETAVTLQQKANGQAPPEELVVEAEQLCKQMNNMFTI